MRTRLATASILVIVVLLGVALLLCAYQLLEGKQAVVTRFGRPVRFVEEAGLHFRIPMVEEVHFLEKRLLPWDGAAESMQTRDKKRIFIDVWARWRIADAEEFFRAVRTEDKGQKILDDLVDSAVRNVVAQNNLIDVVRSTNDELVYQAETIVEGSRDAEVQRDVVETGRAQMEETILRVVEEDLKKKYGMELVSVKVKRVNYIESVKKTVYERMRSERKRIAMLFESEAEEERNRIVGLTQKELDRIEGEMEQKSAEIRGTAEGQVIAMTAESYGKNLEFYGLLRRLEVFQKSLGANTRLILSTDSDLLRLLKETADESLPVMTE
jgi:membrane protease subunit HflC